MQLRNLHRRARPFRYFAFWSMAGVCLLLVGSSRALAQTLPVAVCCLAWPLLADQLDTRLARRTARAADAVLRVHRFECLLCGSLFGFVALPPLPALAAAFVLLGGLAAQAGHRVLYQGVALLVLGSVCGFALAPVRTQASTTAADLLAVAFGLVNAIALGEVSFRQALRLHTGQQQALGRAARLASVAGRMEAYLAPSLRTRIAAAPREVGRRERRWVTVVFVDLVGFTELAARMEAETLAATLDEYLAGIGALARRHGGEVVEVLGDGVLVAHGLGGQADRRMHVAAALAFVRDSAPLLEDLRRRCRARGDLVDLHVRAGVASGMCTVGDWGGADYRSFTIIGTPVNLASRLQASAPVDGVLLDGASAALAEPDHRLGQPLVLQLKGIGEVSAWPLGEPPGMPLEGTGAPAPAESVRLT